MAESLDAQHSDINGSPTAQSEDSSTENKLILDDIDGSATVETEPSSNETELVSDGINGSAAEHNETSSNEHELILNDIDSLWDEVNARLHISRFVTDSVIKGIVSAVEQEAARKIASKDAEIETLNQKLQQQGNSSLSLSEGRDKRYDEIFSLRKELSIIAESLLNSEWGLSVSQYNFDGAEDVSKHRGKEQSSRGNLAKENSSKACGEEVFCDPTFLHHMDRDDLIAHFNKEMNKMKRQHDSAIQEKTEEIFKLKREILKKDGSTPWHLRNNKEFEQMRKKIWEVISKLDELLSENKRTGARIKTNNVDSDIQQLRGAAINSENGTCNNPAMDLQVASMEKDHAKHVIRLESEMEDANIATIIKEETERILLKEYANEIKMGLHGCEMEFTMEQDICSFIQNEAIEKAMLNMNSLLLKYNEQKDRAEVTSIQKQEIEKLKQVIDSFGVVMREKEEILSQIELESIKGHINALCHELDFLRGKVQVQESYMSEKSREFDMTVDRLEQALQHVHRNDITLSELNDRLTTVSNSLQETDKQNQVLYAFIEEKEKTFTSTFSREKQFKEFTKNLGRAMIDFENFVADQLTMIATKVLHNELRFNLLKEQCKHLVKEGALLRKKALKYKEISDTRGSNLQKAELEVDLLGDEVDLLGDEVKALTDLLAKIYIALDHYSPVLQHYTGVMEILNMIKKHISISK